MCVRFGTALREIASGSTDKIVPAEMRDLLVQIERAEKRTRGERHEGARPHR
jgi:hypothetical protein